MFVGDNAIYLGFLDRREAERRGGYAVLMAAIRKWSRSDSASKALDGDRIDAELFLVFVRYTNRSEKWNIRYK